MKKSLLIILFLIVLSLTFFGYEKPVLTVYIYDSLKWLENYVDQFEQLYGCEVKLVKLGDAGSVLARLKLEKRKPKADIIMGLDQSLMKIAIDEDLIIPYKPVNWYKIKDKDLNLSKDWYLTPYDYGAIAIIYDPKKLKKEPKTFEDLTKPEYKRTLLVEDPRTSSTGQAFLIWTISVYGKKWEDFWKRLKPSIYAITPSWDEAFALFEKGEAPMMVSYATDGAYSYHYYGEFKYKTFIPKDGAYVQKEGLGIVKGSRNIELAKRFIEFILSDYIQEKIPLNQWMFPVVDVQMPESFKYALIPEKIVETPDDIIQNIQKYLEKWEEIMSE